MLIICEVVGRSTKSSAVGGGLNTFVLIQLLAFWLNVRGSRLAAAAELDWCSLGTEDGSTASCAGIVLNVTVLLLCEQEQRVSTGHWLLRKTLNRTHRVVSVPFGNPG